MARVLFLVRVSAVWLLATVLFCAAYGGALAALAPEEAGSVSRQGGTVYLAGVIGTTTPYRLATALVPAMAASPGGVTLHLNSPGGNLYGAIGSMAVMGIAGRIVPVTTAVAGDDICMSACTLMFTAARNRLADERAVFLFHAVRQVTEDGPPKLSEAGSALSRHLLAATDPSLVKLLDSVGAFADLDAQLRLPAGELAQATGGYLRLAQVSRPDWAPAGHGTQVPAIAYDEGLPVPAART